MNTDSLHQAVDTISDLLKRLWELRQKGEFNTAQTKAIDRLVDEAVASLLSVIRRVREKGASQRRASLSSSPVIRKASF